MKIENSKEIQKLLKEYADCEDSLTFLKKNLEKNNSGFGSFHFTTEESGIIIDIIPALFPTITKLMIGLLDANLEVLTTKIKEL